MMPSVQDDDGLAFVQHLHQRVERFVAHILPPAVGRQFDTVGAERIERINSLLDGGFHIGQRQRCAEKELAGVIGFQSGACLVIKANNPSAFVCIAIIRLRRRHRKDCLSDTGIFHKCQMGVYVPFRQRERLLHRGPVSFQKFGELGKDIVGMYVYRLLCHDRNHRENTRQENR